MIHPVLRDDVAQLFKLERTESLSEPGLTSVCVESEGVNDSRGASTRASGRRRFAAVRSDCGPKRDREPGGAASLLSHRRSQPREGNGQLRPSPPEVQ